MTPAPEAGGARPARHSPVIRALSLLAGAMIAAVFVTGAAAGSARAGSVPPSSPLIRAEAIAKPSVVYIGVTWSGWVWVPPGNSARVVSQWYKAPAVKTICSGFVASPSGFVVTAGHCVDDQSMTSGGKLALTDAWLAYNVTDGKLTESEAGTLRQDIALNGRVEGKLDGSAPARSVTVVQLTAPARGQAAALAAGLRLSASVVDLKSLGQGDVALLKVNPPHPMAALQVAAGTPQTGTQVISAGYPGSVAGVVDTGQQPSFKTGSVSSTQTVHGVPFIEVNADNSRGMSGGPTVDMQGRVVGTVSFGASGEQQAFNFITDTSVLRSLLARNGLSTALNPADRAYRVGLADYYAGRYHDAVAEFDKVLAVEPNHALAGEFRAKAVASYPNEVTGTSPWIWAAVAVAAVIVVAGAVVTLLLVSRRRRIVRAAGPVTTVVGSGRASAPGAPGDEGAAPPGADRPAGTYCPNCGVPHEADARFCEVCGRPLARAGAGRRSGGGSGGGSGGR